MSFQLKPINKSSLQKWFKDIKLNKPHEILFTFHPRQLSKSSPLSFAIDHAASNQAKLDTKLHQKSDLQISIKTAVDQLILLEYQKSVRGETPEQSFKMLRSRLKKYVEPYFSFLELEQITSFHISKFIEFLKSKGLKPITISQYLIALKKLLTYCKNLGVINDDIPEVPHLKITSTPRGGFTLYEYLLLLRSSKELRLVREKPPETSHRNTAGGIYAKVDHIPFEFNWLIRFMVNSFVRPVDIKLIQHKHVKVIRGDKIYLRLTLPETKSHKGQIVTLRPAVSVYESLVKYFEKLNLASQDDYLFLPQIKDREAAMYLIGKHFQKILMHTNLRKGTLGQNRTLYSLRHTAITFRLLYGKGIDLLTLARNARTSVEMIEKFYASDLSPEMNIDMIQSRRT